VKAGIPNTERDLWAARAVRSGIGVRICSNVTAVTPWSDLRRGTAHGCNGTNAPERGSTARGFSSRGELSCQEGFQGPSPGADWRR
jgi:hypothetical protein